MEWTKWRSQERWSRSSGTGKGKAPFCCCSAITQRQKVLTRVCFIHWWKYLCLALHNVNLGKTTAAGGSLIKIPLCTMGRQAGGWCWKARSHCLCAPFHSQSDVCPLAVNAHRHLDRQYRTNLNYDQVSKLCHSSGKFSGEIFNPQTMLIAIDYNGTSQ